MRPASVIRTRAIMAYSRRHDFANAAIAASRVSSMGGEDGQLSVHTVAQALTMPSIGWSLTDHRATHLLP
jgi:hypothetical protein